MLRAAFTRRALSSAAGAAASAPAPAAGRLLLWGTGEHGKLGLDDQNDREVPCEVPALANVKVSAVACSKYHTAALAEGGEVYTWGMDQYGQLGHGDVSSKHREPRLVEALSGAGVTQVACGEYHSAAVTADGRVLTWGYGGTFLAGPGGLGLSSWSSVATPTPVPPFGPDGVRATAVSCGAYHTIAQTAEGELYSWGRGEWGRLGHGGAGSYNEPLRLEQLVEAKSRAVIACESHSVCLDMSGRVHTWGRNEHWQLGYEITGFLNSGQAFDAQHEPFPVELPQLQGDGDGAAAQPVALIGASDTGTVAIAQDGRTVLLFGFRKYFEPHALEGSEEVLDSKVVEVGCGDSHVLLRTEKGGVYCWGRGAPLGLPQADRKQWALAKTATLDGERVLRVGAGSFTSAAIVA